MAIRPFRIKKSGLYTRHKLLIWATIIGVISGVIGLVQPLDHAMQIARNSMRMHPGSRDIVVVGIDDQSVKQVSKWPWSPGHYAQLIDSLRVAGASRIFLNVDLTDYSGTAEERQLVAALARAEGRVVLTTRFVVDPVTHRRTELVPPAAYTKHVQLANVNAWNSILTGVKKLPYAFQMGGQTYPSLSALLAGRTGEPGATYPIDYSVDFRSIPVLSAGNLMNGSESVNLAGKSVVVGTASRLFGDNFFLPGNGPTPAVFSHVLGGETLKKGRPLDLGMWIPLLVAIAIAGFCQSTSRRTLARLVLAASVPAFVLVPLALEDLLIFTEIMSGVVVLTVVIGARTWARFRQKSITTNPVSGLPNLNALRIEDIAPNTAFVAARIHNFAEITSALPQEMERVLVGQITHRIALGSDNVKIYQGDEGIFAWLVNKNASLSIGDELEALHALFRSPLVVEGRHIDLALTFGVDMGSERLLPNRLGSALVAADEASHEGLRWKAYDPAKLEDAEWKLSLLGRLDAAIDSGEIWVAYQPKLDIATNSICGAEALARWSHPEKGDISPEDFILAAEQHNRIEKLTAHVLNEAIKTAAAINDQGIDFGVSVNLSTRLLDNPKLVGIIKALLARHGLPPERLTLEVTESAAITDGGASLDSLEKLRLLGLGISIDDYGTGFSTLDYLKKVPANEIKIDKSFVDAIDKSKSDRLMVNSTISLAHSLDRKVVAEGVERPETLQSLEEMGCDLAQGYLIGRPMPFRQFWPWLEEKQTRMVA